MTKDLGPRNKDLAIIIPTIGLTQYCLKLIDTICSKRSKEVLIIWNGGTDDELTELKKGIDTNWVSIFVPRTNLGVARSWNCGIQWGLEELHSKYTMILNNDTLLGEDCIDIILNTMINHEIPLVTGFDYSKECDTPDDIIHRVASIHIHITDSPQFSCFALDNNFLSKMVEFERGREPYPGRFDENFFPAYFEDNDFHLRLKKLGKRCVNINQALYFHYGSRTIKENKEIALQVQSTYLKNQDYFEEKHSGSKLYQDYKKNNLNLN